MALDYFTLEELRDLPDVDNEDKYPDARVVAAAEYVQGIIEGECQTSFVPRPKVETLNGVGTPGLVLSTPYVQSITSVVVDGVASTDSFSVVRGVLQRTTVGSFTPLTWAWGTRNVVVTYMSGYSDVPPPDIKEAALQATRARLMSTSSDSTIDDRRTSITNDAGTTVSFVIAGEKRPTGYPEVDAVINRWAKKLNTVTYP